MRSRLTAPAFELFDLRSGVLFEDIDTEFPTSMSSWNASILDLGPGDTHFGFVVGGECVVSTGVGDFTIGVGMYFSIPGQGQVHGRGQGVVISRLGFNGTFLIGGPIEPCGRLRYIDGCTDSLLIPPPLLGDPCLNALYFPPGVDQTEHTHPTLRAGVVASGTGECVLTDGTAPLEPGRAFVIRSGCLHRFRTFDSPMVVIAFHPDSDFGPTHDEHPMINRTMVDGVPASQIDAIRTKQRLH